MKRCCQALPTLVVSSSAQIKPLVGKVFYLDLPSSRAAETLESDIKELGGTVEKFFSKEIKYLVTNKREARYVQYLRQDSPVPSPDSEQSSPHPCSNPRRPGSHADTVKSRSHGQADTHVSSRGKSLVERVVKEQERVQMNKILSNALEWGVKILYIDDIIAYVQKRKKIVSSQCPTATTAKTSGRIGKPFVKVEDSSRHYRPIYITMPNIPEFNLKAVPPCSPFFVDDKDPLGNRQQGHRGAKASATEERVHGRKKNRDKKRGGYCECCMVKYENLTMHLKSERHKGFSRSDKYLVVDRQVSTLHCNFIHIKTKPYRKQKERPPSQNLSPVQEIRRKIKVYKRKRRKLDMDVEQVKPNDALDNNLLKIWELFQSSDDMDVEFHGFEA
uniref:Protein DBF4 homolog A n=1 Tax=Echeneis naucrates TaxID=173247 RepID=A0A665UK32_ECHNA